VPPEAARPTRCGGCPVPHGGPFCTCSCRMLSARPELPGFFFLPARSPGVPPEAVRPAPCGGCPVPHGGPGHRVVTLRVLACRRRRRAPPGAVAARCRTVTRAARLLLYESWRAAGGGAPHPVRWLPGAGRWPVLHVLLPDAFSLPGAAGFFLPTCPESWRTAGGGAPRPVRWLPGAARWPGPPGCCSTSPGVPP